MAEHILRLIVLYIVGVLDCGFSLPIPSNDPGLLAKQDSLKKISRTQSNMQTSMHLTSQDEILHSYQLQKRDQQENFCLHLINQLKELEKSLNRDRSSLERIGHDFDQSSFTKKHEISTAVTLPKDVDAGFLGKEDYSDGNDDPEFEILRIRLSNSFRNLSNFNGDKPTLNETDEISFQAIYKLDPTSLKVTLPNCKNCFNKTDNLEFLLNLINRIKNNRNAEILTDFGISSKEKRLHFLNILNALINTSEILSNFPEKANAYTINDENEISSGDDLLPMNEQANKMSEVQTTDFNWNNKSLGYDNNDTNVQISEITEETFFETFEFGSGNEESSLERLLGNSNSVNELDVNISGSGDSSKVSRSFFDVFSNSENTLLISKNTLNRFSNVESEFMITGSGNGS